MIFLLNEYFFKLSCKFDIFLSIMFRSFCSLLTSCFFSLCVGPYLICLLKKLNIYQVIRCSGPKLHISKKCTPTMGGIMIIFSIILSIFLWSDLYNRYIWYVIFILISYGIIGFFDDYYKILKKNGNGLSIFLKYCLLSVIALLLIVVMFILEKNITGTYLIVPFFKNVTFQLGIWYVFLGYLVIVGTSNAVNLSDGLDGLVIMPIVFITFGLGIIALIFNNIYFNNNYLCNLQYIILIKELVVLCSAIIGSGLGFLWFNIYPAQIFMGDVGSLSLGGALGVIAVLLHQELSLLIMGALFVLEAISVILQIYFFKLYGYRIFLMAPIHHHFELKGIP